jgi:hypothetical protein
MLRTLGMSAFAVAIGGKEDIPQRTCPLLTQSGHQPAFHVAVARPISTPIKALH